MHAAGWALCVIREVQGRLVPVRRQCGLSGGRANSLLPLGLHAVLQAARHQVLRVSPATPGVCGPGSVSGCCMNKRREGMIQLSSRNTSIVLSVVHCQLLNAAAS